MARPRYSIGIDLGTTNSALAYVPLNGDAPPDVLQIPQWDTTETFAQAATLPSFLYLPEDAVAAQLKRGASGSGEWIVGRLARRKAGEVPGRVVRSAKSWLCHHTADRSAPILPWGSEDLDQAQKISPVHASALILNYLREAWNDHFAAHDDAFDSQEITVTVPASFDAAAQRLTLTAAEQAGFPSGVRLLEEPQAAFYCWLEKHSAADALWGGIDGRDAPSRHVLIVDIGGGTSDFSLFELRRGGTGAIPDIRRIAVSEHILLGGDNVDLALAHMLEQRITGDRGQLSGLRWEYLVALARDLKEQALSGDGGADQSFTVALPGRGSSLIASAQSAVVTRADIEHVVLTGFFPECDARARPYRATGGLRDWGLPYATDSAITHHLADFLRGRPQVDAVLFNGGSLHSAVLRERLVAQIGAWQAGARPQVLENAEPDLAVARGAARSGKLLHGEKGRIAASAARAVFLQVQTRSATDEAQTDAALVCVLPRGAAAEELFEVDMPGLELRTGQPVSFQACSSTRHGRTRAGDVLAWDPQQFHSLPPLQTVVRVAGERDGAPHRTLPVRLATKMNALGLLQISCVSKDPAVPQSWPLEFNLRPHERESAGAPSAQAAVAVEPNASSDAIDVARKQISATSTRPLSKGEKLTANTILKGLERTLGLGRNEWNAALLRALWPALHDRMDGQKLSVDHEEAWITLAGFLLRPGFGFVQDDQRMDELWKLRQAGLCFPGKRIKVQEHILWRRLAGGLSAERQQELLAGEINTIRSGKASPELVRLAGSLERLPRDAKAELIGILIDQSLARLEARQHCAPYLAALGLLLNRAPLYAGPESTVPPDMVERTYTAFRGFDWSESELQELQPLFLRAARVVDDRNLDVPKSLRYTIAAKLEQSGVSPQRTGNIKAYTPIARAERSSLYGEALPAGLVLGTGPEV